MQAIARCWRQESVCLRVMVGIVVLGAMAVTFFTYPAAAQAPEDKSAAAFCARQRDLPSTECRALVDLYEQTDGPNWSQKAGWLIDQNICAWSGLKCAGGHVVELNLAANHLQGEIPRALDALPALTTLQLQNNSLSGSIPVDFCKLQSRLMRLDLSYNMLSASSDKVAACVAAMAPGWHLTQTIAPRNIAVGEVLTDRVTLHWEPIPYTADGGFYEVALFADSAPTPMAILRTADKATSSLLITGLQPGQSYEARMTTVTPAHGEQPGEHRSVAPGLVFTTRSTERVLVMVYFSADNELDSYIDLVGKRLRLGTVHNPDVQVIYLADGNGPDDTRIWEIAGGTVTLTNRVSEWWGKTELNTADPAMLAHFLRAARATYGAGAARTVVSLIGHGAAPTPELAWVPPTGLGEPISAPQPGIPALPRGVDYTPTDVTDGAFMSTPGLGNALLLATDGGANPFDLVFLDQCFQGNLDILYEVSSAARVFVASPNYAWLAVPYQEYLPFFVPSATPEEMADAIIRIYQDQLTDGNPNAIFWVRSADIVAAADAVNNLADALHNALGVGKAPLILQAAQNSRYADTTQCGEGNLHLGPPDELIGAGRFAENLRLQFSQTDTNDPAIVAAATNLLGVLERIPSTYRVGYPDVAPGEFWEYDDTITLLAPLERETPSSIAWRASIYRAETPLPAVWALDPQQEIFITQPFASVQDGRWDEFLAEWYTTPMTPTVGEWCNYVPPVVVASDTVENISLTTARQADALRLTWSQPGASVPAGYQVLGRRSDGTGEMLLAIVEPSVQEFVVDDVTGGEWMFRVVAVDDAGMAVALSAEAPISAYFLNTLYLPLTQK